MPATATDRLAGLTTSVAIKPACVTVATFPLAPPLTGLFTLNGVTLQEGDRVLITGQSNPVDNGIYNASSSDWTRALDFDGPRDVVSGTLVIVHNSVAEGALYEVITLGEIVIGETPINFRLQDDPNISYDQTEAEILASVVPVNHSFPPLYVDRYGFNAIPGTTSMAAAFQSAINVAKKNGGTVTFGPGPYLIDAALDLTFPIGGLQNCSFAIIGQGRFKAPTNTLNVPATPSLIFKHAGHCFDTTGSMGVHFENLSIGTDEILYPQTCFLLARNTDESSRSDRITNCYVLGRFSQTVLYNYGAEDGVYSGNQFYNVSADSNTSVFDITGFNARALGSTFTSIALGSQSCLDHKIFGGEYANLFQGSGTTADVFRFDGARSVKMIGPWLDCSAKAGTSAGRCLIYIDGTHAPAQMFTLIGLNGESAVFPSLYSIFFTADAQVHSNIVVIGCSFPNTQYMVGGGTGATLTQLTWLNNTNESQGGGINFTGTLLASCLIDYTANVTGAPIITNETWNTNQGSRVAGESNYTFTDTTQAVGSKMWRVRNSGTHFAVNRCDDTGVAGYCPLDMTTSGLGFNNTTAIAKPTVTGSRGGNAALASLLTALASYGLIVDGSS